ncbi:MAG: preprotein translocase subunit SecA [Chloroflexi bacterium RBG_13_51_36]|nr:MAG: preprotein translocase subunit SecA [Chloroflexi bacterium RBG_13_51_36]
MLKWLGSLIDSNEKELRRLQPLVDDISSLEPEFEKLSDAELRAKTDELKARLKDGESLDEILPEAYAAVREAAKRTIKQRHFDVQVMGGIVLHQGKIAEMKTGEGKTLVATLPLYLNALSGDGCHLVTVNDYLAKRDCHWMGPIYHALGVSVACINAQQASGQAAPSYIYDPGYESEDQKWKFLRPVTRRQAYEADITYGTNNEFGFDYLRDNMVWDLSQCVQRSLNYAIVDEVDNILIDEARTPLIISGAAEEATKKYYAFAQLVSRLGRDADYTIDERTRAVHLTEGGMTKMEKMLKHEGLLKAPDLYDPSNHFLTQYMESALKAHALFKRDKDYVVKDGQVIIVDEFTGRLMFGRRYSEGLHQAIEAKERVKIQRESVTLATITFQNYFRMYLKLGGMTGTAATEAEEFHKIYKLEVLAIPTNKPLIRTEHPDQIYRDEKAKFGAVAREIKQLNDQKRPVLIGTTSIEKSEYLSDLLKRNGIPHQVLNAKNHEKEAAIIAQAGRLGTVTVATNMAGRGVDIILGGSLEERDPAEWQEEHKKVVEAGGLHIVGTEHHEARRIDNQLRGRSGRQGDPGSSRFYASLEDEIVRRFGGDRVKGLMQWAGMDENTPIEHSFATRAMTNSQVQTEGYHFNIRKHLVEYDDVVNTHREVIYSERRKILGGADLKANITSMVRDEIQNLVVKHLSASPEPEGQKSNLSGLLDDLSTIFPLPPQFRSDGLSELSAQQITEKLTDYANELYNQREQELGPENMRIAERLVMLRVTDQLWMEHLTAMEHLRQGIGLRAVGQEQPLVVYKREGHAYFEALLASIQHDVAHSIYHVGLAKEAPQKKKEAVPVGKRVGRNDPCPCGSGKKYKHCCGK